MILGKKILAIIPARGGSKGVPGKNIKILSGKPLISYSIEAAKRSEFIDKFIVSTDDDKIAAIAKQHGAEVPYLRPKDLSTDLTPMIDVVLFHLSRMSNEFDYLILLQPTSPLRDYKIIDKAIEFSINKEYESLVSVSVAKKHPYYMYEIKNGRLKKLISTPNISRRQELEPVFTLNGAIYFNKVSLLMKEKNFINEKTMPFIMNEITSIDIDDEFDFRLCELFIRNKSFLTKI